MRATAVDGDENLQLAAEIKQTLNFKLKDFVATLEPNAKDK